MVPLSNGGVNLNQIIRWDDFGVGVFVVFVNGEEKPYHGEDADKLRAALHMMRFDADEIEQAKATVGRVVSKEFGEQEDGTLIAKR